MKNIIILSGVLLPAMAAAHDGAPGHIHGLGLQFLNALTGWDGLAAVVVIGLCLAIRNRAAAR